MIRELTETKQVDAKGRITLSQKLAGRTMLIETMADGSIILRPAVTVPVQEAWLWKNPSAMASVQRGLKQARSRQFVKGPNLRADAKLVERLGED